MFAHHHFMIADTVRTEAYRRAIHAQVRPGDIVIDFGTGTGVMALFAAQAGVRKVYALEKTALAHATRDMVAKNGFSDVIEVIQSDATTLELPEQADWLISEMMDTTCCDEYDMSPLGHLRDRFLKPTGGMIPHRVESFLQLFSLPTLYGEFQGFYQHRPYGLDWSMMVEEHQHRISKVEIPETGSDAQALCNPISWWPFDMRHDPMPSYQYINRPQQQATLTTDGVAHGLVGWFRADLGGGEKLTNAPFHPLTHWKCDVHWLDRPIAVKAGDGLMVQLDCGRTLKRRYYPRSLSFSRNGQVFHEQHVTSLDLRYADQNELLRKSGRFIPQVKPDHRRLAAVLPLIEKNLNAHDIARLAHEQHPDLFPDVHETLRWLQKEF